MDRMGSWDSALDILDPTEIGWLGLDGELLQNDSGTMIRTITEKNKVRLPGLVGQPDWLYCPTP